MFTPPLGGLNAVLIVEQHKRNKSPLQAVYKQKMYLFLMCASVAGKEIRESSIAICVARQSTKNSQVSL